MWMCARPGGPCLCSGGAHASLDACCSLIPVLHAMPHMYATPRTVTWSLHACRQTWAVFCRPSAAGPGGINSWCFRPVRSRGARFTASDVLDYTFSADNRSVWINDTGWIRLASNGASTRIHNTTLLCTGGEQLPGLKRGGGSTRAWRTGSNCSRCCRCRM